MDVIKYYILELIAASAREAFESNGEQILFPGEEFEIDGGYVTTTNLRAIDAIVAVQHEVACLWYEAEIWYYEHPEWREQGEAWYHADGTPKVEHLFS